jgi:hypothetical protein
VSYKSFHLYDVDFDLWSVESIGLSSVVMWGGRGEIRWCSLSKYWNGGEGCDLHGLWLVTLKSANDRVIGVDTLGQQVPPSVWYGMACLLLRYATGCVSCSVERRWLLSLWSVFVTFCMNCLNHMVQKEPLCVGNLSTATGAICRETVAKHDILL